MKRAKRIVQRAELLSFVLADMALLALFIYVEDKLVTSTATFVVSLILMFAVPIGLSYYIGWLGRSIIGKTMDAVIRDENFVPRNPFVRWLTRELDFANDLHADVEQFLKTKS